MVEVMIEQWKNRDGSIDFMWSVWRDGARVEMGGAHKSAAEAKATALMFCETRLGLAPDAVTEL
jgi:hypothetical protein